MLVKTINFLKYRKFALIFSLIFITIGIIVYFIRGGFVYGIDFTGGANIDITFSENVSMDELRGVLGDSREIEIYGLPGEENTYTLKLKLDTSTDQSIESIKDAKIKNPLINKYGEDNLVFKNEEVIEPTIGVDLRNTALSSAALVFALILVYISLRFRFKWSVAAIIAIVHDVCAILAFILITGREMNTSIVVAILTIAGYSINDTIVVFDRIRENTENTTKDEFEFVANRSLNQTLARTIITSLTTILAILPILVLGLVFLGASDILDLALALFVGVIIGTYSSIFIASPVIVTWENYLLKKERESHGGHGNKKDKKLQKA